MLGSESTVTDVAWTQWSVRWGAIPADVDMFFIMFSSVLLPTGEFQYHISSFCGLNFVDTSLSRWNRGCRLGFGIQVFKEAFKGFHRAELWIRNLKHLIAAFVGVICQTVLEVYTEEPTCLRWAFSDFHVPFYRNKRLCKTMQCGGVETDPRYPTRRVALFRTAVAVVRSWTTTTTKQNLPLKIFIPYFAAFSVFSGMELSSKLSKTSFEISTKSEAAAIVSVDF